MQDGTRVAIVSGGTSGIGAAVARRLADDGWRVLAGGLAADLAKATTHDGIDLHALDVTDDASVAALVAAAPRVDALVNCAGTLIRQGGEYEIANFARVLDVNLTGTMRLCMAAQPKLAEARGAIVNTASMYSFFGAPHAPAYAASKGGIVQLTKSLAVAWAAHGIRVNAIAPGWIDTPLTAPAIADAPRSATIVARTPMGRWGLPADVAGAARMLLSPDASFVTGTVVPVDGGYLAA